MNLKYTVKILSLIGIILANRGYLANGQSVVAITGPDFGHVDINNGAGVSVFWSQDRAFNDLTITARLGSFGSGAIGRAFLTTRIGPGTTISDQIVTTSFSFPENPSELPLFSGINLPAGDYYLTIACDSSSFGAWWGAEFPEIAKADGVTVPGHPFGYATWPYYLPSGEIFQADGGHLFFSVVSVPEPSTIAFALLGIGVLAWRTRKM